MCGLIRGTLDCRAGIAYVRALTLLDSCINKESSSELSEAFNSMYRWYEGSSRCYAYLSDIDAVPQDSSTASHKQTSFLRSRWFTRGWTLQELIASPRVAFYAKDWSYIGTKHTYLAEISKATRIPREAVF